MPRWILIDGSHTMGPYQPQLVIDRGQPFFVDAFDINTPVIPYSMAKFINDETPDFRLNLVTGEGNAPADFVQALRDNASRVAKRKMFNPLGEK